MSVLAISPFSCFSKSVQDLVTDFRAFVAWLKEETLLCQSQETWCLVFSGAQFVCQSACGNRVPLLWRLLAL